MLDVLDKVLADRELFLSPEGWNSLDIDYHPPRVERIWKQWGEYRIYLHRIHPCKTEEALFHPHPWPSAMLIADGCYEMGVGQGASRPEVVTAAKIILGPGSRYEMVEPLGWHYVRPLVFTYTLMITGKPWSNPIQIEERPAGPLSPLDEDSKNMLLNRFRSLLLGPNKL